MSAADSARPEPGPDAGIDDIEADIERNRAELGADRGRVDRLAAPALALIQHPRTQRASRTLPGFWINAVARRAG
ncbi:MAG TPA: DUF3618 domain-containing protein [Mycobacterium sp.]|nr:MAG: DUF3618 domain-containing protein [Mycobacterium sp.]HNA49319.1 DUF3618 domain-containing protein [Mycobacterium sp.]HRD10365.1 DUF3618 domain-containing protein [Mycobacterium sp.]